MCLRGRRELHIKDFISHKFFPFSCRVFSVQSFQCFKTEFLSFYGWRLSIYKGWYSTVLPTCFAFSKFCLFHIFSQSLPPFSCYTAIPKFSFCHVRFPHVFSYLWEISWIGFPVCTRPTRFYVFALFDCWRLGWGYPNFGLALVVVLTY